MTLFPLFRSPIACGIIIGCPLFCLGILTASIGFRIIGLNDLIGQILIWSIIHPVFYLTLMTLWSEATLQELLDPPRLDYLNRPVEGRYKTENFIACGFLLVVFILVLNLLNTVLFSFLAGTNRFSFAWAGAELGSGFLLFINSWLFYLLTPSGPASSKTWRYILYIIPTIFLWLITLGIKLLASIPPAVS